MIQCIIIISGLLELVSRPIDVFEGSVKYRPGIAYFHDGIFGILVRIVIIIQTESSVDFLKYRGAVNQDRTRTQKSSILIMAGIAGVFPPILT